jgi:hypothetical protein
VVKRAQVEEEDAHMQRYRVELLLGLVFLALFLGFCLWVSPGSKLTHEEVAASVAKIEHGLTMPEPDRSEFLARLRAWGDADDGEPVYLANMFHYKDPIEPWPGHDIKPASAQATHQVYLDAVVRLILPKGVWPSIGTKAQGMGSPAKTNLAGFYPGFDDWSEININRYPSRRAVLDLISDPAYLKVMPYKFAALKLITVPVSARFVLPDLRLALGAVLLLVFLLVGWIRAARHRHE